MSWIPCDVYRSPRRAGTYLFVARDEGLERVPEVLLKTFGTPELALSLVLTAQKKLARADAVTVMQALQDSGYYLQMPPSEAGESA